MRIKKSDLSSIHENRGIRAELAAYKSAARKPQEDDNGCLCFLMGFCFSLFGVLIAAIIGKTKGVRSAFLGMFLSAFLAGLIWFFLVVIGAH